MRLGAKRSNSMPLLNHARFARYWTSMSVSLCPRMNVELFRGYTVARLVGSIAYLGLPVYDSLKHYHHNPPLWSVARYLAHTPYFSLFNHIGAGLRMRYGQIDSTCLSEYCTHSLRFASYLLASTRFLNYLLPSDIASQELSRRTSGRVMLSHLGSEIPCFRSIRDPLSIAWIMR